VTGLLAIREARGGDEDTIFAFLKAFADFEKLTPMFRLTHEIIARDFLSERRRLQCEIAEWDGVPAGLMIWIRTYATFLAAPALYIEDLYVDPQFRRRGIGRALLTRLAQQAIAEGAIGIEWCVLDWNARAIQFYDSIGAPVAREWRICRLRSDALRSLAAA
jgi:GNAT superfamily N-acetyltransferase